MLDGVGEDERLIIIRVNEDEVNVDCYVFLILLSIVYKIEDVNVGENALEGMCIKGRITFLCVVDTHSIYDIVDV